MDNSYVPNITSGIMDDKWRSAQLGPGTTFNVKYDNWQNMENLNMC